MSLLVVGGNAELFTLVTLIHPLPLLLGNSPVMCGKQARFRSNLRGECQLTGYGVRHVDLKRTSDTSITAKSADGFTQIYTIAPGSRAANSQLAVNDTVTIRANVTNNAATATTVTEGDDPGPGGPAPMDPPQ